MADDKVRIPAVANLLVQHLNSREGRKTLRRFAMIFGDSRVGNQAAESAAEKLRAAINANQVTTLSRLLGSYHRPFAKAPRKQTTSRATTAGQSSSGKFIKQLILKLHPRCADSIGEEEKELVQQETDNAKTLLDKIHTATMKLPQRLIFFNDSSKYGILQNEADVSERVLMIIERPCLEAMNILLNLTYPDIKRHVYLQAEEMGRFGTRAFKADHVFKMYEGSSMVVVEYKAPRKIRYKDWMKLMWTQAYYNRVTGQQELRLARQKRMDELEESVRSWLAQLLTYAVKHNVKHTMATDGEEFIPIIWKPAANDLNLGPGRLNDVAITRDTAITALTYLLHRKRGRRTRQIREEKSLLLAPEENIRSVHEAVMHLLVDSLRTLPHPLQVV